MIRLLFTSGRGPAECRIALAKALDAFTREAAAIGLDTDIVAGPDPDGWGLASAVAVLHGKGAESLAFGWIGSIQWTAPSPVRPHHKRKNWFIGVVPLPAPKEAAELDAKDVRFEAFRAGGPGGQHQNKTESAVRAVHSPTGLAVVCRSERSQHRNKAEALVRMAAALKLRQELATLTQAGDAHAAHDRLERGRPVRRFAGADFKRVPPLR
jgi:peptide chain release factor